ncbi:MAG: efflux RND transporter periplasmic adaptor subunit [Desulfurella sp.]|uniref:efflux RND transporter periplasmic adaptor subunit n=1 Tax=Desulfurella sp. TaxID=1962857 RepID=UPI003D0AD113
MKRVVLAIVGFAIIIIFIVAYLFNKNKSTQDNLSNRTLIATVNVAPIKVKTMSKYIVAYGIVESKPGTANTVSLNFDATINKLYVVDGQNVVKGQLLFSVIPSPTVQSQLMQAENSLNSARENLKIVQEKFKLHLVSKQDILNAQNALNQARIIYDNLKKTYTDKVYSSIDGVVTKINYTQGSSVVSGSPILSIADVKNIAIKCGVEPEDVNFLKPDLPAIISLIDYNKKITGKIISISNIIDPATHLINIYILPDTKKDLILNSYVEVNIPILTKTGLGVPKSALLYEDGHYVIYTVKNGVAKKHVVNVILKNEDYALVSSPDLTDKDLVVTQGAYELKNNMNVKVQK